MRVLDLFCGAGGASVGYFKAGFDVTGVDINPQPNYPFEFIQADAFEVFATIGGRFDLIHASPPCQYYSWGTRKGRETKFPRYIPQLKECFFETPYVIENIMNAKKDLDNPIMLCGTMFNLRLLKHRLFESNMPLLQPEHKKHVGSVSSGDYVTVAGHGGNSKTGDFSIAAWQEAMGINWLYTRPELAEAIPPSYTEYIGIQLMDRLSNLAGSPDCRSGLKGV